jgi:hypothetical protein
MKRVRLWKLDYPMVTLFGFMMTRMDIVQSILLDMTIMTRRSLLPLQKDQEVSGVEGSTKNVKSGYRGGMVMIPIALLSK